MVNQRPISRINPQYISPHSGIVVSLSKPSKPPEKIIDMIQDTEKTNISTLFNERSIGQIFKGVYHHKETLRYVWPITTKDSQTYRECLKEFLDKFIPSARLCDQDGPHNNCCLSGIGDLEMIEQTKALLSNIYSKENLSRLGVKSADIIVDISGGTKSITIGLIFGALDSTIDIQYVEQQSGKYEIIPLLITPQIILDKTAGHMLELYSQIKKKY